MVCALEHGDPLNWHRLGDRRAQVRMAAADRGERQPLQVSSRPFQIRQSLHPSRAQRTRSPAGSARDSQGLEPAAEHSKLAAQCGTIDGANRALLPLVRQFRIADPTGFDALEGVMPKLPLWQPGTRGPAFPIGTAPLKSPPSGALHHLALPDDWCDAQLSGSYRVSTRGRTLERWDY